MHVSILMSVIYDPVQNGWMFLAVLRSLRFWRSEPTCCASPWRRCVSSTTPRPSSAAPSSSTTSSGVCGPRSCCRAPTGASRPTRRSPAAPASCRPPPAPPTERCPPGSAWRRLRPVHLFGSVSEWSVAFKGIFVPTAAASTQRRLQDITSTCRSPCTTPPSLPARPRHTPPSFS